MFPWEYARLKHSAQLAASPQTTFSTNELARLTQVQARFYGHPEYMELALDERRLGFARWLVESGRLSEEV